MTTLSDPHALPCIACATPTVCQRDKRCIRSPWPQQAEPSGEMSERERFEAVMKVQHPGFPLEMAPLRIDKTRPYMSAGTQHMWNGWQAALRSRPKEASDFYLGGPYVDNTYAICETGSGRVRHVFDPATDDHHVEGDRHNSRGVNTRATRPRWKHVNGETLYTELGRGTLQSPIGSEDMKPVVIYQDHQGNLWVRNVDEFEDGRFERV